tara:strand:+ start:18787 stop:19167 length:381 start_codon:yes stop_codon:yes gene_type:complete
MESWTSPEIGTTYPLSDMEYRAAIVDAFGIDDDDHDDIEAKIAETMDCLFKAVGSQFSTPIQSLKSSPTKSQYLLLFGKDLSDQDIFVMLTSYDTFPYFAACLNDLKRHNIISELNMENLVHACSI